MQGREPSMEDILASIKKVIAEEKELRTIAPPSTAEPQVQETASGTDDDVLELEDRLAPDVDLGPPLIDESVAGQSRQALEQLTTIAASVPPPPPPVNPLEEMIREMLRPILKQWLDDHLPGIVEERLGERLVELENILFLARGFGGCNRGGRKHRPQLLLLRDHFLDRGEDLFHRWFAAGRLHRRRYRLLRRLSHA